MSDPVAASTSGFRRSGLWGLKYESDTRKAGEMRGTTENTAGSLI